MTSQHRVQTGQAKSSYIWVVHSDPPQLRELSISEPKWLEPIKYENREHSKLQRLHLLVQ